jgi:hypothetical protein
MTMTTTQVQQASIDNAHAKYIAAHKAVKEAETAYRQYSGNYFSDASGVAYRAFKCAEKFERLAYGNYKRVRNRFIK